MSDYKVYLVDNRVNVEISPYLIAGESSWAMAIERAKQRACADAGVPYNCNTFSMIEVEIVDAFGLVSIEEVDPDPRRVVV